MDDDAASENLSLDVLTRQIVARPFIAQEILEQLDSAVRKDKLARIIETAIVPRLFTMHSETLQSSLTDNESLSQDSIETLAKLILGPNIEASSSYILSLKDRGLSMEGLFVSLLEPTARHLGSMWDNDECDFVDVTFGVARLQQLLSMFNCSYSVPAFIEKRRVCMLTIADEKHSFGVSMVEKFLRAGGWRVHSERAIALSQIPSLMMSEWFAVVGLTIGSEKRTDDLAAIIRAIRQHSRNPSIGVMVGLSLIHISQGIVR